MNNEEHNEEIAQIESRAFLGKDEQTDWQGRDITPLARKLWDASAEAIRLREQLPNAYHYEGGELAAKNHLKFSITKLLNALR